MKISRLCYRKCDAVKCVDAARTENGVRYTVCVPANTTAELMLVNGERRILPSGTYEILL